MILRWFSLLKHKVRLLFRKEERSYLRLLRMLGQSPKNGKLYAIAFTHRSSVHSRKMKSNERLEYLGDSVISLIVGETLFTMFPDEPEGQLTNLRSILVNRNNLNNVATRLYLDRYLRASKGLDIHGSDALGNCLEALVGAIYLDEGFAAARRFVRRYIIIDRKNIEKVSIKEENYKTEFIILMQQNKFEYEFRDIDTFIDPKLGLMHRCQIFMGEREKPLSVGVGPNKKTAHQNAAKDALRVIERQNFDFETILNN